MHNINRYCRQPGGETGFEQELTEGREIMWVITASSVRLKIASNLVLVMAVGHRRHVYE
jgi:hypothetical protein